MIVIEYMPKGDLLGVLQKMRPELVQNILSCIIHYANVVLVNWFIMILLNFY